MCTSSVAYIFAVNVRGRYTCSQYSSQANERSCLWHWQRLLSWSPSQNRGSATTAVFAICTYRLRQSVTSNSLEVAALYNSSSNISSAWCQYRCMMNAAVMKRNDGLSTLETARRWLFLFSVIFFVTGLIMTGKLCSAFKLAVWSVKKHVVLQLINFLNVHCSYCSLCEPVSVLLCSL